MSQITPDYHILHISDLHRDPGHPVSNDCLLNSLERDRDRYRDEQPSIPDPDFVVVSGDLVQGIPPDSSTPIAHLAAQYEQAEDFLVRLTHSFVRGQRHRVIIVPGNHDVSTYHTRRSLRPITVNPGDPANRQVLDAYVSQLQMPNSSLRWSWQDLCFYEVADRDLYLARLDAFCTFYRRFYQDERTYSLEPSKQYDIFDFPDCGIAFAAFNSCCNNDPLNTRGAVHPDCVAGAASKLRAPQFAGRLLLAVWHHGTSGGPHQSDYLDADTVQSLIDSGFSIGLHGHQHKSQVIDERFRFGGDRKMTVICAGSLSVGPAGLPAGHSRTYNMIQIDTDNLRGRLHVRRMQNETFDQPIWGRGQWASTGESFADFAVQRPAREAAASRAAMLGQAERLVRSRKHREAIALLRPLARAEPLARRLLLECYIEVDATRAIADEFYPPVAIGEVAPVADALWAEKEYEKLRTMLGAANVRDSADPGAVEVRRRYLGRLKT